MKKIIYGLVLLMLISAVSAESYVVSPTHMHGWAFLDESTLGGTGTGQFVDGSGMPPIGDGSAKLEITAGGGANLYKYASGYEGMKLSDLTALEYSTYREDDEDTLPNMQLEIDYHCDYEPGNYDGRLVFLPGDNGAVENGTWQTWNTLNGVWYASRSMISNASHSGMEFLGFGFGGSAISIPDLLTMYPDACIHPVWGGIGAKVGTYSSADSGYVDMFVINDDVYNFETEYPWGDCLVTKDSDEKRAELVANCTTDETLLVEDGWTIDGNDYIVTAVDPNAGHFIGAVIMNDGAEAYVEHIGVTADSLANVCDGGADRLRGIMFEGASGYIVHSDVFGINQGPSGCQEGNAVEVRNGPFDGTHPDTQYVEISHNKISDYQKTGLVCNGDVVCQVEHNDIGDSATQENLAANSVQFGFGATGIISQNNIEGNQWMGISDYAATALLIYLSDIVDISKNVISGNSDIGIYGYGDFLNIDNNKVFDEGEDHINSGYDIGVGNWGLNATVTNNKVKGFDDPYDGVEGGKNKVIHGPQNKSQQFW